MFFSVRSCDTATSTCLQYTSRVCVFICRIVQDKKAAALHNDSVNRIMRLSLRRAKRVKAAASAPSSAGSTDAAGASSVAGDVLTSTGTDSVGGDGDGSASTTGSGNVFVYAIMRCMMDVECCIFACRFRLVRPLNLGTWHVMPT